MLLAVQDSALIHPAAKNGLDGKAKLEARVTREAHLAINDELRMNFGRNVRGEDLLEFANKLFEVLGRKIGVVANASDNLLLRNGILKKISIDIKNDVREHLDEATIRIPGETRIFRLFNQALHRFVVKAKIQNGIHHAGHGERGTGTHGNQQRVVRIAELLAHATLEIILCLTDLVKSAIGPGVVGSRVLDAGLAGDGESRRNRQADARHLGKVGALAAERVIHARCAFGYIGPVLVNTKTVDALLCAHDNPLSSHLC